MLPVTTRACTTVPNVCLSFEGSWDFSSYGFDGNYGRNACDMLGLSNDGKMGVYLQAKDISFMEDLTHVFRVGFIKGTNNTEMARTITLLLPMTRDVKCT